MLFLNDILLKNDILGNFKMMSFKDAIFGSFGMYAKISLCK